MLVKPDPWAARHRAETGVRQNSPIFDFSLFFGLGVYVYSIYSSHDIKIYPPIRTATDRANPKDRERHDLCYS